MVESGLTIAAAAAAEADIIRPNRSGQDDDNVDGQSLGIRGLPSSLQQLIVGAHCFPVVRNVLRSNCCLPHSDNDDRRQVLSGLLDSV